MMIIVGIIMKRATSRMTSRAAIRAASSLRSRREVSLCILDLLILWNSIVFVECYLGNLRHVI